MDKVKGRDPQIWPAKYEAVNQLKWVESTYAKVSVCSFHFCWHLLTYGRRRACNLAQSLRIMSRDRESVVRWRASFMFLSFSFSSCGMNP